MRNPKTSVFLLSVAALAFEVAAARLASFLLLSQYAYLSLAMAALGGAVGAALVARHPDRWRPDRKLSPLLGLSFGSATLGLIIPWPDPLRAPAFVLFAGLPYLVVGAWMAGVFQVARDRSNQLYFYDLSGAATGVVVGLILMQWAGPLALAGLVSLLSLGASFRAAFTRPRFRLTATASTLILTVTVVSTAGAWLPGLTRSLTPMRSKSMGAARALTGLPIWTRWSSFSRVDVVKTGDPDRMVIFTDGGAATETIRYNGDLSEVAYLGSEAGAFPFTLKGDGKTLIIGPGGGKDLLLALLAGSTDVTAVEVNPLIVEAVADLAGFTGNPYADPRVKTLVTDGRAFVRSTREQYDLIYLSLVMTGTAERNAWGLNENFIYTTQAMADYLAKLRPGGEIGLVLHDGGDVIRAVGLSLQALMARGVPPDQAARHLGLFTRQPQVTAPRAMTHERPILIVSRDLPSAAEVARWKDLAGKAGLSALLLPDSDPKDTLLALPAAKTPREALDGYVKLFSRLGVDARPATDDRPFFYAAGQSAPRRVAFTLGAVLLAGVAVLIFSLAVGPARGKAPSGPAATAAPWIAAASGLGYMLVEVSFIQTLRGLVAEPTVATGVVLSALLVSSGLGSLSAGRLRGGRSGRAVLVASLITSVALLAYPVLVARASGLLAGASLARRVGVAALAAAVPGFAMGLPFPYALGRTDSPAAVWMANGVCSVIGSVAALLVAMTVGLSFTLGLGALTYGAIAVGVSRLGLEPGPAEAPRPAAGQRGAEGPYPAPRLAEGLPRPAPCLSEGLPRPAPRLSEGRPHPSPSLAEKRPRPASRRIEHGRLEGRVN